FRSSARGGGAVMRAIDAPVGARLVSPAGDTSVAPTTNRQRTQTKRQPILYSIFAVLSACCSSFGADVLQLDTRPPTIVATVEKPIVDVARQRLADYLHKLTGAEAADKTDSSIVLGDASLAKKYAIAAPDESRDESFSVAPVGKDGKSFLIISGQTDRGIKNGVHYVLKNLAVENGKLIVRNPTFRSSPVLKLRV